MVNSYGWKRCAPGFQRAENRYFDTKRRSFRIFGTTRRFDGNAVRVLLDSEIDSVIASVIEFAEQ
jgi:hypothetical protein